MCTAVQQIGYIGMVRRDVRTRHIRASYGHAIEQLITAHRGPPQFGKSRSADRKAAVHRPADQFDLETNVSPQRRVDLLEENRTGPRTDRLAGGVDSFLGFRLAAGTGVRVQYDQVRGVESIQPVRAGQHGDGEAPLREGNRHIVRAGEVVGEDVHGCCHSGTMMLPGFTVQARPCLDLVPGGFHGRVAVHEFGHDFRPLGA